MPLCARPERVHTLNMDCFPSGKADDAVYDLIAAVASIPNISKAWSFDAGNAAFRELTVRDVALRFHRVLDSCYGQPHKLGPLHVSRRRCLC